MQNCNIYRICDLRFRIDDVPSALELQQQAAAMPSAAAAIAAGAAAAFAAGTAGAVFAAASSIR